MSRDHFRYRSDPPTVYHAGRTLPLRKGQARLLAMLLRADMVTVGDMLRVVGIKNAASLRAHLCAVRKHLPPGVRLVNDYGKGYRLLF